LPKEKEKEDDSRPTYTGEESITGEEKDRAGLKANYLHTGETYFPAINPFETGETITVLIDSDLVAHSILLSM